MGICHGAAGNAHIFNRLYQATGEASFKAAALFWYEQIFTLRRTDAGIAGFPMLEQGDDAEPRWVDCVGLLNGAVGVGLVLLAACSETIPDWDGCLLVSVPPQAH